MTRVRVQDGVEAHVKGDTSATVTSASFSWGHSSGDPFTACALTATHRSVKMMENT